MANGSSALLAREPTTLDWVNSAEDICKFYIFSIRNGETIVLGKR